MTVPIMLAPPPVVHQTAQTCWAAAYESWQRATGNDNAHSTQQMIDLLEGIDGMTYDSGRATPQGMSLVQAMGLIHFQNYQARTVTIERLGFFLQTGHLYIVYFRRPGTPAHAVVGYGVDSGGIYVMDPMPDRGLITQPANFFLTMPEGTVMLGLSMTNLLAMSVDRSLRGLREQAWGLSSADVMGQFR